MSYFETVKYDVKDGVATILLNRPDTRNSFDAKMRSEFLKSVKCANESQDVRVVVISGEGKGFCAGAHLGGGVPDEDGYITRQIKDEYVPFLRAIVEAEKPYIAAVNGAAVGIGAALVMSCDLVVMANDAFLYSAFGAISLIPDGGFHWWLTRHTGPKKAYEIILESQRMDSQQCFDLGLCNKVVPKNTLREEALNWAQSLCEKAPLTARYSKYLLSQVYHQSLAESMNLEAEVQNSCVRSQDFSEGKAAFIEKRKAIFSGK